ncbi:MAG: DNA-binding protein [Lachnospiraceae bacterium]|nr:DNA-binding protein [Lachnospiraceae bacterium]
MRHFTGSGLGRVVIVELTRGDLIIESVEAALAEEGIKNAIVATAVGSVMNLEYHRPLTLAEVAEDEYLSVKEPFELGNIAGTVIDGVAHFHFSAASPNGIHIGHLEKGTTALYLAELTLVEIKGIDLERRLTPENVRKLFPKK